MIYFFDLFLFVVTFFVIYQNGTFEASNVNIKANHYKIISSQLTHL